MTFIQLLSFLAAGIASFAAGAIGGVWMMPLVFIVWLSGCFFGGENSK